MERSRKLGWFVLELLVVFLGVTAAFVLDNWGEARHERAQERLYLEGLYRDAERDSASLEGMSQLLKHRLELLERLFSLRGRADSLRVIQRLVPKALFSLTLFKPGNDTWESLKAGGDLKLIRDLELRRSLTRLDKLYFGIQKAQEELQSFGQRHVEPWALANMDLRGFRFRSRASVGSPRFWNFVAAYILMVQNQKRTVDDAATALDEVLRLLRAQLNR